MPPRPTLRTARLVMLPQGLEAMRAVLAGGDGGLPLGPGYPHADTYDALRMAVEHGEQGEGGWWITSADSGAAIGDAGTKGWVDEHGAVEIGYGLAAPSRGRGFGTEAVRAIVDWLLTCEDVGVVTAEVERGNTASVRLLRRLGFVLTHETTPSTWWERRPGPATARDARG